MQFDIYRYDPEQGGKPTMQRFVLHGIEAGMMLRDALIRIKAEQDETLSFRHSCGEN